MVLVLSVKALVWTRTMNGALQSVKTIRVHGYDVIAYYMVLNSYIGIKNYILSVPHAELSKGRAAYHTFWGCNPDFVLCKQIYPEWLQLQMDNTQCYYAL